MPYAYHRDPEGLYEGTKRLYAWPMTRGEYNDYRDWDLPARDDDAGYLVEYVDGGAPNDSRHTGYISWSPADVFEKTYYKVENVLSCNSAISSAEYSEWQERDDRRVALSAAIKSSGSDYTDADAIIHRADSFLKYLRGE